MTATSSWYAAKLSLLLCRLTFDVADGIEVPLMMHGDVDVERSYELYTSLLEATIPLDLHVSLHLKSQKSESAYPWLNTSVRCNFRLLNNGGLIQ